MTLAQVPERHFRDPDRLVGLRIGWEEKAHQARLRAVHARWDPASRLWWMPLHLGDPIRPRRADRHLGRPAGRGYPGRDEDIQM